MTDEWRRVWVSHTIPHPFKPVVLVKALGEDWFLAGSASSTIGPDRGPETQPDRSVENAASPMGTGDRWVASSSDITEVTPEPSMPDVDRSRRGACRTVLGTNHGRTPIAGAVLHGYTSLRQKPLAPLTLAGTKETTKVHLRRRLLYLLCLLRT